jgi:superfamily II DNA helicase RecQ
MAQKLQEVFGERSPYHWQLDAAEALILGLDCVVVAGTGARTTIPFALPLHVQDSPTKLVLVISPLNTLETDQVRCLLAVLTL